MRERDARSDPRANAVSDYPAALAAVNHVEPVPRRIRAFAGAETIVDTLRALYVWETPNYPQYYIPGADVNARWLVAAGPDETTSRGTFTPHALAIGDVRRDKAALHCTASPVEALVDRWRFEWDALDRWFEEDEEVFVHPRSPYTRVDALRSTRVVRVELEGVVLAESSSPVMVFETGLPTRYYLNRTDVRYEHLIASPTVTRCPYKGETSAYWSVSAGGRVHKDLAWSYAFPTRQLSPIAGLVAFYNERLDILVDGVALERKKTPIR